MKKIQVLIISILFLTCNLQASLFESPQPYSFGPEGRTMADLRDFAKPKQMASILPNRPVAATDSSGARVYYTPDGKMTLTVAKDGTMTFSLGGVTKEKDSLGNLTKTTTAIKGSGNLYEIKNEFDEVIGYKALDGEGNTSIEYDKDMNKTKTYNYGLFGKTISYVVDEMTKEKTTYDQYGREMAKYDADGYILSTYQYEDVSYEYGDGKNLVVVKNDQDLGQGLLVTKKDYQVSIDTENKTTSVVNTTTFFDKEGLATHVTDSNGFTVTKYNYDQDDKGNKVLTSAINVLTKEKTYYENGKETVTKNDQDVVVKKYYWEGSKLLYTINLASDGSTSETTVYDIDGTELYTTFKNITYNDDGTIDKVMGNDDEVWEQYYYKEDAEGNKIIDYVENVQDKTKTYYDDEGRQTVTKDEDGNITKDYNWNGNTLIYVFDRTTQTTQWYNADKEVVYETFNERIITKNIYNNGQLVGRWNAQDKTVAILINEREWLSITAEEEPTANDITKIISLASLIEKKIAEKNSDLSDVDVNKLLSDLMAE
ncbi:MAG: hypothetical protein WCS83_05145 [Endomicrobiia bacterium]|nr:hypothetical protein [Endomicrobiaceae bacterium]MDD3053946.1 hypothetical protein [Endomicrobiaceae bacterium]MDD3923162.1 hypothetical protein [Endomicrobiaceae bacterium]